MSVLRSVLARTGGGGGTSLVPYTTKLKFDGAVSGGDITLSRNVVAIDYGGVERAVNTPRFAQKTYPVTGRVKLEPTGIVPEESTDIQAVGKGHDNQTTVVVMRGSGSNSIRVYHGTKAEFSAGTATQNVTSWSGLATALGAPSGHGYSNQAALVHHGLIVVFLIRTVDSVIDGVTVISSQNYGATWSYVQCRDTDGTVLTATSTRSIGDVPKVDGISGIFSLLRSWAVAAFPVDGLDDIRKVRITWCDYQAKSGNPGGGQVGCFEASRSTDTGTWTLKDNRLIYEEENADESGLHNHGAGVCSLGLIAAWGDVGYRSRFSIHAFDWDTYETATITNTPNYHGQYIADASAYYISPQPVAPSPGPNGSTLWSGDTTHGQIFQTFDVTDVANDLRLTILDTLPLHTMSGINLNGTEPLHLRFAKGTSGKLWTAGLVVDGSHLISRDGVNFARLHLRGAGVGGDRLWSDGDTIFYMIGAEIHIGDVPSIKISKPLEVAPGALDVHDEEFNWNARRAPGAGVTQVNVYYDGTTYRFTSDDSALDPQPPMPPVKSGGTLKLITAGLGASVDAGRYDMRELPIDLPNGHWSPVFAVWPYDHAQSVSLELLPYSLHSVYRVGSGLAYQVYDTEKWTILPCRAPDIGMPAPTLSRPMVQINIRSGSVNSPCSFLIQCLSYNQGDKTSYAGVAPTETARPNELFSTAVSVADSTWTVAGTLHWPEIDIGYTSYDYPLIHVFGDSDNHIVMVHDAANGETDIVITSGGSVVETLVLATGRLNRNDTMHFAISSDGNAILAAVSTPQEFDIKVSRNQLSTQPTAIRNGNADQSEITAIGIHALGVSDRSLGSDDVWTEFNRLRWFD